ncbi:hypothetical protein CEP51_002768 [Fusarium floridanum]|uniref:Uncharacterized protein n=1 Tax=Fusarium floridanum TaxID=1325733 RepID=A0A428S9N8_9HYPO|nr:hypothetical protein CEP51_002768 [Fusarium floridanum]
MTSTTSDVYFCFGPTPGSFILDTKKRFSRKRMPGNMMEHLTNVQKIYYVAVDHENNGVFGYKDRNGEVWHSGTMITFVALNPWVAGEFFLILDNDTAFFAVHPSLEAEVTEILREQGIECNALVKHNPTRTVAKRKPAINVKNKDFMKELLGHAFGGSVGAVVGAVITGMSSCSVM